MYFLSRQNLALITWRTVFIPGLMLVLIVWMSLYFGRLYCNTICPVGTLLGLLSRISMFKIRMDADTCTKCGKCSFACKSSCINVKTLEVDFSRCVACYDCISVCPENSIRYGDSTFRQEKEIPDGDFQAGVYRENPFIWIGTGRNFERSMEELIGT